MALNVISNFAANVAHRNLVESDKQLTSSLSKLSSGTRVVSAKDDAASLAIGSRLEAEVGALRQAQVNAGQAVSMLQVADGAMARTHDILMRMKVLAVQAGSGQLSGTERGMLDTEYQALLSEIDRLAADTEFNGNQLVNGAISADFASATDFSTTDGLQAIAFKGAHDTTTNVTIAYNTGGSFSVTTNEAAFTGSLASGTNDGTNMTTGTSITLSNTGSTNKIELIINTAFSVNGTKADGTISLTGSSTTSFIYKVGTGTSVTADSITVAVSSIAASALGLATTNVTSVSQSDAASNAVTAAVDTLNVARADLGAAQNRLEFASVNIATTLENMEAARSNLLDLDIAAEMSVFTSKQILVQAGVAMLAQANQQPQALLQLLQ